MTARLSLGPVFFNWPAAELRDFYFRVADEAAVDSVHLGEVVCAKRAPFFAPHLAEAVERLRAAGVEVLSDPVPYETDEGARSLTTYFRDPDGNALCLFEIVEEG